MKISELTEVTPDSESYVPIYYQGRTRKAKLDNLQEAMDSSELKLLSNLGGTIKAWILKGADMLYRVPFGKHSVDFSYQNGVHNNIAQDGSPRPQGGASGSYSFAGGFNTLSSGSYSFAYGYGLNSLNTASGLASTSFGCNVTEGNYSFSVGLDNKAQGAYSCTLGKENLTGTNAFALGKSNEALGTTSICLGAFNKSTGMYSTTTGYKNIASGKGSFGTGCFLKSQNDYQTSVGKYNVGTDINTLFEVGCGTSDSQRKNALEVHDNGIVLAPQSTVSDATSPKSLITKEYLEQALPEAEPAVIKRLNAWMFTAEELQYHELGTNAVDFAHKDLKDVVGAKGKHSIAMGRDAYSTADYSCAIGAGTKSTEEYSTVLGSYNVQYQGAKLVLGIGTPQEPKNGLVITEDEIILSPQSENSVIHEEPKALVTTEYLDAQMLKLVHIEHEETVQTETSVFNVQNAEGIRAMYVNGFRQSSDRFLVQSQNELRCDPPVRAGATVIFDGVHYEN